MELQYELMNTARINAAFDHAPAAMPVLVSLGHSLATASPSSLEFVMKHVEEALPGLDSCLVMEYTITICSALVVSYSYILVCLPDELTISHMKAILIAGCG